MPSHLALRCFAHAFLSNTLPALFSSVLQLPKHVERLNADLLNKLRLVIAYRWLSSSSPILIDII
jgi:hypothetical protein